MRFLGYLFGFLMALCSIPLLIAAICNLSFTLTLTNSETYKEAFASDSVFENLLPVTIPALIETANTQSSMGTESPVDLADLNDVLTSEDWGEISNLLVPSAWLKQTYNSLVDTIVAILNNNSDTITTTIDISEIRKNFKGTNADAVAEYILSVAPDCNRTQSDALRTFATNKTGIIPICAPADSDLQSVSKNTLKLWLNAIGDSFEGDTIAINDYLSKDTVSTIALLARLDRQALYLLYLCPIGLLALLVAVTVRSAKGFGRWIGITSLIAGIGVILWLLNLQVSLLASFSSLFDTKNDIERFTAQIASGLLRATFSQSAQYMLLQAGILIVFGFILLAAVSFIKTRRTELNVGDTVLLTDDGQIISTATKRKL